MAGFLGSEWPRGEAVYTLVADRCRLARLPCPSLLSSVPPRLFSPSSLLLLRLNLWLGTRVKFGGLRRISPLPSSCVRSFSVRPEYLGLQSVML